MRRQWMVGVGGAAVLAAGLGAGLAQARDAEEKDVVRARPRAHVARLFGGGGGRLGVSLEEVGAEDVSRLKLSAERGAVVKDVHDGSAADKAGLKAGDVIVRFGGDEVWSASQLARLVRETPPGRAVRLGVSRDGSPLELTVTLAKQDRDHMMAFGPDGPGNFHFEIPDVDIDLEDLPHPPAPPDPPSFERPGRAPMARPFVRFRHGRKLGLAYEDLGAQLARFFKVEGGVLVTDVDDDGAAGKAGIKAGDVIVRVDGKDVKNGGDLRSALRDVDAESRATIGIRREGRAMDVTVTVD